MTDHYRTLGIENTADARQIKRAYFDLVKQFPPERFPEKFKEIRAAYDALSDENKRAQYDETASLPKEAAFLVFEAQKARKLGQLDHVAEIYGMILKSYPELSDIRAKYARSLEALGKTGKALEEWEILCKKEPNNVNFIAALADCYDLRGWRKKAIGAYKRALELDGGDIECWTSLIECHLYGHERDDASRVSLQAVEAVRQKGKESVHLYTCCAIFGAKGNPELIESNLKDIVRMARAGASNARETQESVLLLLKAFGNATATRFYPYIREIADTLQYMEDDLRSQISKEELRYEISKLEEKGFSILFRDLLGTLSEGCKCEECKLDIAAMECNILGELSEYRPQIILLKNDYPKFFALHADFFNEVIRTNDPERMFHARLKYLSKNGMHPNFLSGNVDSAPVQQTVRREGPKIGRNDPCPCGSGKKYKKCCGA